MQILKACSLTLEEGEMVAILGRSGAGKTTLLNLIAMLDRDYEGTYLFDGSDVRAKSDADCFALRTQAIGYVFQDFQLIDEFTGLQNVELPLGYQGIPRKERQERSLQALQQVGLGDRGDSLVAQLSGGEKQRIGIARALVYKPRILLADEPTGNLDPQTSGEIMQLLRRLNEDAQMTELIVTHDREVAKQCSRVLSLQEGKLVEGSC